MPFALVTVGIVLMVASMRNTQDQLFTLVKGDFTGPNNFVYWFVSILLIGAIGYIPKAKPFSVAMLALVIIVLVLARGNPSGASGGFFQQFTQALKTTQTASAATGATTPGTTSGTTSATPYGLPNLSTILPHI
jgi:hypothetical protein